MRQLDKGLQKGFYVCVQVVSASVSLSPNLLFHSFLPLFGDTASLFPTHCTFQAFFQPFCC